MESMYSKTLRKSAEVCEGVSQVFKKVPKHHRTTIKALALTGLLVTPQLAFAQFGGGAAGATKFFCYIATYFKQIVGAAAFVALLMWAIEHIFGVAKLHDVVIKVGIAAAIVIGSASLIAASGLSDPGCELSL